MEACQTTCSKECKTGWKSVRLNKKSTQFLHGILLLTKNDTAIYLYILHINVVLDLAVFILNHLSQLGTIEL